MASRARALAAGLALTFALASPSALAQVSPADKETARRLMDEGDKAYSAGDHATALAKYKGADAIMGVPTTTFEVGKTLEAMGKLVEARDAYLRVVRFGIEGKNPAFEQAKQKADAKAQALTARIATLQLTIEGADDAELDITIDGEKASAAGVGQRSMNPGEHAIVVKAPGYFDATETVTLGEGETKALAITLKKDPNQVVAPVPAPVEPKPAPTPVPSDEGADEGSSFPIWATVGFSVGAVGLGVGTAFGILSLGKTGDLEDACPEQSCPAGQGLEDTQDEALLFANISNVGFAVGGAGVVFGVIALFTLDADDEPDEAALRIEPVVGPGYLGVTGTF